MGQFSTSFKHMCAHRGKEERAAATSLIPLKSRPQTRQHAVGCLKKKQDWHKRYESGMGGVKMIGEGGGREGREGREITRRVGSRMMRCQIRLEMSDMRVDCYY